MLKANAKYFSPEVIDNITTATVEVNLKGLKPIPDYRAPRGGRELGQLIMRKSITLVPNAYMVLEGAGKSVTMRDSEIDAFVANGLTGITGIHPVTGWGIALNFGGTTVGSYDCGETEPNNRKAFISFHFKGANGTEEFAASGYCQSNGNTQETKYSSGKVIIKRFDNDMIEGEFSGPLYARKTNRRVRIRCQDCQL